MQKKIQKKEKTHENQVYGFFNKYLGIPNSSVVKH